MKIPLQKLNQRSAYLILLIGSIAIALLYVYVVWIKQPLNCSSEMPHEEHTDYVLSLSYLDQITCAAMRVASLQCWADQHGMAVVEPFVNVSYLGMPPHNYSSPLTFEDLFDVSRWNLEGQQIFGCFSPLVKWNDFIHNAPREVVVVQILYRYAESHQEMCTFPRIMRYWASDFKPHGFRIIKRVCLDIRKLWLLTEGGFSSKFLVRGMTLIFEQWRGIGKHMMLILSGCTNKNGRTLIWNGLDPSATVQYHAQEYLKHHLKGGDSFVTVMLRIEYILLRKDYYSVEPNS